METLFTNKKFIKVATVFVGLLCVSVLIMICFTVRGSYHRANKDGTQNTISVTADDYVNASPDIANLSFTLTKEAGTSKEAQSLLNTMITKVMAYTKEQKIADVDVKSEYGGVSPKYNYNQIVCVAYPCPQRDPVVTGYIATQTINIKVREVDNANQIRTGLTTIGVKDISGPTFSIEDEDILKTQARDKAIAKAQIKAKALARALDVDLGDVVNFSENNGGGYPMMYAKGLDMAVSSMAPERAPNLPKGENKVTSSVTITYEIR